MQKESKVMDFTRICIQINNIEYFLIEHTSKLLRNLKQNTVGTPGLWNNTMSQISRFWTKDIHRR